MQLTTSRGETKLQLAQLYNKEDRSMLSYIFGKAFDVIEVEMRPYDSRGDCDVFITVGGQWIYEEGETVDSVENHEFYISSVKEG